MDSYQGIQEPQKPSILKRGLATLVLIAVLALILKVVIGFVIAIFWIVVAVAAIVAVLWALNTLL
jgi:hypothetical protein